MRVLILDGHSPAALETAQSLGRRGARIDVACEADDCLAFSSRYVSGRLKQPPVVPLWHAKEWLQKLCLEHFYDLVVPSTDASMVLMRQLNPGDPLREKAQLPSNASLDVAFDKHATHQLGERLGIRVPATRVIEQGTPVPPCSRYPVILKSVRSRVVIDGENRRMSTVLARDAAERERVLSRWLPHTGVQQQECVAGHGYGIEMLFDRGRLVWHFAHERIHELPLTGGGSCYRRSIAAPPAMLAAAERLLTELAWHGVAMVEFRGDASKGNAADWYLMEINPRLWGSLALPIDCGVDFPWGLALLARGEPLPLQPDYRTGYYTRQLLYDLSWQKLNLRADPSDPWLLTRPRLKSAVEYLRPLWGRESWDHFDWNDLRVVSQVLRLALRSELERLRGRFASRQRRKSIHAHHAGVLHRLSGGTRPSRVLFLCYGNICRSPVAQVMARAQLSGVEVASAGFHPNEGRASPPHLCRAAGAAGADLGAHVSRRVSEQEIGKADLILCMDLENLDALQRDFPEAMRRATLLGLFADPPVTQIDDPFSLSDAETRQVVRSIRAGVEGLARWLGEHHLRVTPTRTSGNQVASPGNAVINAMQSTIMKKNGSDAKAT